MENEKYYKNLLVSICKGESFYLDLPPFNPHCIYPEYTFKDNISSEPNPAYEAVRNCFRFLKLDMDNFGSCKWNPLRDIINTGDRVIIKPNFVLGSHYEGGNLFAIITHPSVIRSVIDYVYKAMNGEGEILIADAPQMDCNFNELLEKTKLRSIQEFYWEKCKFDIKILDLRDFWLDKSPNGSAAYTKNRIQLLGDPLGSTVINLGRKSEFYNVKNGSMFYGADYNRNETISHQHGEIHEYKISKTILSADVIISIPKFKVHKKVGVTLNAKGLVGINTNKNYIIHYTLGTPDKGGDQFPQNIFTSREKLIIRTQRFLYDLLLSKKNPILDKIYETIAKSYKHGLKPIIGGISEHKMILDGGNWYGNDSAWRMVSDLVKIIIYADKRGILEDTPQRKVFSVIDGIIGGENNGPLTPDEKRSGTIISGFNPLAVDIVGTRIMGFDWQKLMWIVNLINNEHFEFFIDDVNNISLETNIPEFQSMFHTDDKLLAFNPHLGWQKHIEVS